MQLFQEINFWMMIEKFISARRGQQDQSGISKALPRTDISLITQILCQNPKEEMGRPVDGTNMVKSLVWESCHFIGTFVFRAHNRYSIATNDSWSPKPSWLMSLINSWFWQNDLKLVGFSLSSHGETGMGQVRDLWFNTQANVMT